MTACETVQQNMFIVLFDYDENMSRMEFHLDYSKVLAEHTETYKCPICQALYSLTTVKTK